MDSFLYQGREYAVAAKVNLRGSDSLENWLELQGYPTLDKARVVAKSNEFTIYACDTYTYLVKGAYLFIFSVSDPDRDAVPYAGDRVYSHLLSSFRVQ